MNFICKNEELERAIFKAEKITGRNLSLPILEGILIETKKGIILIKTTNLEMGIEISIPASVKKEGRVVIPSNLLYNFISNLDKNESVEFKEEKGNIEIMSNKNSARIKLFPKEDFPNIPKIETKKKIFINSKKLTEGLKAVLFSASTSNIKPELSSVYVRSENGKTIFVSTDSFRLSEKSIILKKSAEFNGVLIPQKNISEIIRSFEDIDEEIEILLDENQISFKNKNIYLLSRIIEGNFPDYNQIIPKEYSSEVIVLKEDLIKTLKISRVFIDNLNQIKIKINKKKKILEVETQNKEYGGGKSSLPAEVFGEDIEINFNHKYIQDSLSSIKSDSVKISISGAGKPMLIRGLDDESFRYIVMPMNK